MIRYAVSAAKINEFKVFKPHCYPKQIIHRLKKRCGIHILRTHMLVKADDLKTIILRYLKYTVNIILGYGELRLLAGCDNLLMHSGPNPGIDPYRAFPAGIDLTEQPQLIKAVKAYCNSVINGEPHLIRRYIITYIEYLLGREACLKQHPHLSLAHRIGVYTDRKGNLKDFQIGICLNRIIGSVRISCDNPRHLHHPVPDYILIINIQRGSVLPRYILGIIPFEKINLVNK